MTLRKRNNLTTLLATSIVLLNSALVGQAAAQPCMPSGLVSWWPGDGTAEDVVGSNDGTLFGDAGFAPGLVGDSFSLDGNQDWVNFGNDVAHNFGSRDFTVSLWALWDSLAGEQVLIEKWDNGPFRSGWTLTKLSANSLLLAAGIAGTEVNIVGMPPGGMDTGNWHQVALSRRNGRVRIYWDGEELASGVVEVFDDTSFPLLLGRRSDSRGFFHAGLLDEVQIYDRALCGEEIRAIFGGSAAQCGVVAIDVKPGADIPTVNPESNGVIHVAILGSDALDVSSVDEGTLAFGPSGAPSGDKKGGRRHDVNRDGFTDLVVRFSTAASGIVPGDTEALLIGEMVSGAPFVGCDEIRTVPPQH